MTVYITQNIRFDDENPLRFILRKSILQRPSLSVAIEGESKNKRLDSADPVLRYTLKLKKNIILKILRAKPTINFHASILGQLLEVLLQNISGNWARSLVLQTQNNAMFKS